MNIHSIFIFRFCGHAFADSTNHKRHEMIHLKDTTTELETSIVFAERVEKVQLEDLY